MSPAARLRRFIPSINKALFALGGVVLLACDLTVAQGANLTFDATTGTAGAQDGTGAWSTGGGNFRNTDTSTDNVTFTSGDAVTFGAGSGSGAAGTVTITNTVTTTSITFAAPGSGAYTITGGTISMTNGTITQNANGTISSVLAGSNITKTGTGTLTLSGSGSNTFTGAFNINAGTVILNKTPSSDSQLPQAIASGATVNIGDGSAQAILQLGRNHQIFDTGTVLNFSGTGSTAGIFRLNGFSDMVGTIKSTGGAGIIENSHASTASTLTVNNATNDTYTGIIRNAATTGAALHFTKANTGTLTLTGTNNYTGTTTVRGGTLELAGGGSLTSTSNVVLATGGTLKISNTASSNSSDRLANAAAVTLHGGSLVFANDGTPVGSTTESVGVVTAVAGASTVSMATTSTNDNLLFLYSLSRNKGATVNFTGLSSDNYIMMRGVPGATGDRDHGLIGGWATVGNEFAKYVLGNYEGQTYFDPTVKALVSADYVTSGETNWTFESNAKITGDTTLTNDRKVNSLNIAAAGVTTVNLNGESLRVESGGLLVSGTSAVTISNGALTAGTGANSSGELIVHQNSSALLDITATIVDNAPHRTALVKSGTGSLRLSGANSFTGGVYVNAGTLQLNNANAINAANTLAIEGGTLDLNGNNLTAASLSSQDTNTTGLITNTNAAGGAKTLTVGSDNSSTSFSGQLGANLNLTKTGTGTFTLNQSNAAYAGIITVAEGTLATGGATSLGAATGASDRTIVQEGATLDISKGINRNERLEVAGHGVNGLGAIIANSGDSQNIQNMTLTGHTTLSVSVRYDFDNTLAGGGFNLTKIGSQELALEGANVQNLGDVHVKTGTVTWSGSADLGVSSNTLYVDNGAMAQFYNKNNDSKQITLAGGTLRRAGTSTGSVNQKLDVVNGLKLAAGSSYIAHSNSQVVFQLNTIRRDVGATLNLDNSAGLATTDTRNDAGGILGGFITVNGNDWAKNETNTDDGNIVAYTNYATNDFSAAANNVNVTGTQSATDATVHSLRFVTGNMTLNLSGTNTVASGGILVTGGLGVSAAISNGILRGSASGDLVFIVGNSTGVSVSSQIVDNGGPTALTLGTTTNPTLGGTLSLSGNNTYTGGTFLVGGTLVVSTISDTGNSSIGNSSSPTHNILTFNGGTLALSSSGGNVTTARNVVLLSTGTVNVGTGRQLEFSGVISGETLLTGEGPGLGSGNFSKIGAGTVVFSGTESNTYTGVTAISGGTLILNKSGGATAVVGNLTLMTGATVRLQQSNQIADTSIVNLGGILELQGNSEVIGGIIGNGLQVKGSIAAGQQGVLETNVAAGATYQFGGFLQDGVAGGTISYIKSGEGTQIFTTVQTYTGDTTLTGGTLRLMNNGSIGGALAAASNVIFSGGRLAINRTDDITVANTMSGTGTFTVEGPGSVTISSGANTYSGTTEVRTSTLYVMNSSGSATGSSTVLVSGTGKLAGTGKITGHTIVSEGGQIRPGDTLAGGTLGTLTLGNVTLNRHASNSVPSILFQYGGIDKYVYNDAGIVANAGNLSAYLASMASTYENETGDHDRLIIDGTLNMDAGATIELRYAGGSGLKAGDVLDLMDWLDLNLLNAPGDRAWSPYQDLILPSLLPEYTYDFSLFASNGIVVVANVPEPGRAMLLMFGLAGLVLRRRRRV